MRNNRIKTAFRYQLEYTGKAFLWVFGIAAAVAMIIPTIIMLRGGINIGWINTSSIMFIMFFIIGIAGIREDLRFFLQNGMGRRTTFINNVFGSFIAAAFISLFCELLTFISLLWPDFPMAGMFHTTKNFFYSWLRNTGGFFFAWQFGSLLSLIYFRLNRMGQIVFSVMGGAFIIFGLPMGSRRFVRDFDFGTLIEFLFAGSFNSPATVLAVFLAGILAVIGNFLLIKRVQVRN